MIKLLVLCPSRGRPKRLMEMIRSFKKTTDPNHTDLLILLDEDDSCLVEYTVLLEGVAKYQVFNRMRDRTLTTEIINKAFWQHSKYQFYSITNDDMEYVTKGWDKGLCVKGKLSCGKEYHANKKWGLYRRKTKTHKGVFPFVSVICKDILNDVGWLQFPDIQHSSGDVIWYYLSKKLGVFNPNPEYLYIHHSHYHNDGEYDETAKRTDCRNALKSDYNIVMQWKRHKMMFLVNYIKEKESCQEIQEQKVTQQIA